MRISLSLLLAACLVAAPVVAHATPVTSYTYDFTLTPTSPATFGGTGSFTISTPINTSLNQKDYTVANGGLLGLSFTIDNVSVPQSIGPNIIENLTFTLAGDTAALVRLDFGAINDITFAQTIKESTAVSSRFELTSTSGYTFVSNNLGTNNFGTFTDLHLDVPPPPTPTPEPSSLLLLGTGLLSGVGFVRKRMKRS